MNDWGLSVLNRYPLAVRGTRKVRGALLCDTSEGYFLLQEYRGSEKRLKREEQILSFLKERGGYLVDVLIPDQEGRLVNRNDEGNSYILKRWYLFPECSAGNRNDVSQAIRQLAKLHFMLRQVPGEEDAFAGPETGLDQLYEKHTRELHRVRTYLYRKKKKTEIEEYIMKSFPAMYDQARSAYEHLTGSDYTELAARSKAQGWVYHGAYHQHNVLIGGGQIATVNYERYGVGLQLNDLYQFMRKILEKHNWNPELGRMMLEEYHRILPLEPEEKQVLYAMFEYPEKYWKQINFYFNGNKAWTPDKNVEKLKTAIAQGEPRERFLACLRS